MKKFIALIAVRLVVGMFTTSSVALADETKDGAVLNTCVKITMSVKGCGDDRLAPCESSFCYPTYDYALSDLDPMPAEAGPIATKKEMNAKRKSKHHRHAHSDA